MPWAALPLAAAFAVPVLADINAVPVVSLDTEVATGRAPVTADRSKNETTFVTDLHPAAGARMEAPPFRLTFSGGPRLHYQTPNLAGEDRILTLWLANGTSEYDFSERTKWKTDADVSYGEVDYANAQLALGTPVAANLTRASALSTFGVRARSGVEWRGSERYKLDCFVRGQHLKPIGATVATGLPTSLSGALDVEQSYELDHRGSLLVPVSIEYHGVSADVPRSDWLTTSLGVGYHRILDPRTTADIVGGITTATRIGQETTIPGVPSTAGPGANAVGNRTQVFPRLTGALEHVLRERHNQRVVNRISGGLDQTFDPSLGRVYSVVTAEAALESQLGVDWNVGLQLDAYATTSIERRAPNQADSGMSTSTWLGRHIVRGVDAQLGVRYLTRNTRAQERGLTLLERQYWAFARVIMTWDFEPASAPATGPVR